jgi:hypothetical protein
MTAKIDAIQDSDLKQRVMERLYGNEETYQKSDSVIERIANMGTWLLNPIGEATSDRDVALKLARESKSISDTNKSQKGLLQDVQLVRGICSMTQLDYFRHPGLLKIAELNASRPFASGVSCACAKEKFFFFFTDTLSRL